MRKEEVHTADIKIARLFLGTDSIKLRLVWVWHSEIRETVEDDRLFLWRCEEPRMILLCLMINANETLLAEWLLAAAPPRKRWRWTDENVAYALWQ